MATTDCYLKIDKIDGECKHKGAEGQIEVQSFNWDVTNRGDATTGGGSGHGKASPGVFQFVHKYDKSAPTLKKSCVGGNHHDTATLTVCKAGDGALEFLTVKMKQVTVTKVALVCAPGGHPEQTVDLMYGDIEFEYKPQDDKGKLGGAVKMGWDVRSTEVR